MFKVVEGSTFRESAAFFIIFMLKYARGDEWRIDPQRWNSWAFSAYAEAVHTTVHLNENNESGNAGVRIDIPIFVMNIISRQDRRESVTKHLNAVGFTNFSFPTTVSWTDLNIEELASDGMINLQAFKQAHPYVPDEQLLKWIANAYCQLLCIEQGVIDDLPIFGIFEDDLVPARRQPANVAAIILQAVEQLPPTADMLYLEMCHETCSRLSYSPSRPNLMRASNPSCAAAILFTRRGARRVLRGALPIWDVIDVMYPALIEAAALEVNPSR